jgi:hypothetical protein
MIVMQRISVTGALLLGLIPVLAESAVFTVTTTAASGAGSLDAAISAANMAPGADTIQFAIAGVGIQTLAAPAAGYRQIIDDVVINGYSQPGSVVNTLPSDATNAVILIEIDASAVATPFGRVFLAEDGTAVFRGIAMKNLANNVYGIRQLSGAGTLGVHGCFLGTGAGGIVDASAGRMLEIEGVASIGGSSPADRNLISGNFSAINVQPTSTGVNVQGNLIGSNASGSGLLPNDRAIDISANVAAVHLIGGSDASAGNRIVGSNLSAVRLYGEGRATWLRNRIYDNAGLGIDIGGDGIDVNDPGDGDGGPNGRENAPVMYSATVLGSALRLNGRLDGNFTSGTKRVEFFASPLADPTGYGEGDQYLGAVDVFPGSGPVVVEFKTSITPASMPTLPFVVSAIATSADGASSEFSNVVSAVDGGVARTVTTVADAGAGSLRQALLDAAAHAGADTVLFNIPGSGPHTIAPLSALPVLNGATVIDGYSQPGARQNTAATGFDGSIGIVIDGSSAGGVDGLVLTTERSLISGLAIGNYAGAAILANSGDGHVVRGNLIGTDATGMLDRGNAIGVSVASTVSGGAIGGPFPHQRNVIGGNIGGIVSSGDFGTIWGNYIGIAADGSGNLGNNGNGILAQGAGTRILNNSIRFNTTRGIGITGTASRIVIRGNSVFGNGGLGIDLGLDGVTANDPDDADSGPNQLLNFPVLTRVRSIDGAGTLVEGTLDRPAGAGALSFELDFHSNASCDPSGFGEGESRFATATISLPDGSSESFSVWIPGFVSPPGRAITATATTTGGQPVTSEFSACATSTLVGEVVFANGFE